VVRSPPVTPEAADHGCDLTFLSKRLLLHETMRLLEVENWEPMLLLRISERLPRWAPPDSSG